MPVTKSPKLVDLVKKGTVKIEHFETQADETNHYVSSGNEARCSSSTSSVEFDFPLVVATFSLSLNVGTFIFS